MKLTLMVGRAQAWIARRRIAALGTWRWWLWFMAWLPVRFVFCAMFAWQRWVLA